MGGWFSSSNNPPAGSNPQSEPDEFHHQFLQPERQVREILQRQHYQQPQEVSRKPINNMWDDNAGMMVHYGQKVVRDPYKFNMWADPSFSPSSVVNFTALDVHHPEYQQVAKLITNKHFFKLDSVHRIDNVYLKKAYELKKLEKMEMFGRVEERLLFHGTKAVFVKNICTFNFDWRLSGLSKGHKFGKGVNFSPKATYACHFSDKKLHQKVMILARVLIARSCLGDEDMNLPPTGFDTSQKGDDGIVIVKYEDSEFYPAYLLHYHLNKTYR